VLLAQKFDPESLALSGDPFPVAADVNVLSAHRVTPVSAAADGTIVYRTGNVGTMRQFVWADRGGGELGRAGEPLVNPVAPRLSPDGSRVAFFRRVAGNNDIYLLDLTRQVVERLTTAPTNDFSPVWSPDGGRIAYCSAADLVVRSLADGAAETLLRPATSGESACPGSWSRDGRFLLYDTGRSSRYGLWVLPIEPRGEPIPFVDGDFLEVDGAFSPDGKWIAYTSDESGQPEVFIGRFPGPPRKQRVSRAGGGSAVWRHDGRELFYVDLDGKLMSVPLEVSADGEVLEAKAASPLFDARVGSGFQSNASSQYAVAPDGRRFLLNRIVEQTAAPLTVVLDWQPSAAAPPP
jgi:Tol biopolymer transport system component